MGDARTVFEASLQHPELAVDDPAHDGPLVTLLVVTRDGLHHLRRLFAGLAQRTAYRAVEVVVIDNGSTDGTLAWLSEDHGLPVEVIGNAENRSFSEANNQGLEVARGALTVLCNNDVEPIHTDWLTRLVAPLDDPGTAAAGPLLVYPESPDPADDHARHPPLSVQSAGIGFEVDNRRVRGRNLAVGTDPLRPALRRTREVGGLTAACLAARTSDLREIGGLDTDYFYGSEDWDLSLRLARLGRLLVVGRSVLYHHEYGTQNTFASSERAAYRRRNHAVFNARWGAEVRRGLLLEHFGERGLLSGDLPSTFVTAPDDDTLLARLGHELRALGWVDHDGGDHPPTLELIRPGAEEDGRSPAAVCVAVATGDRDTPAPHRADLVVGLDGHVPSSVKHVAEAAHSSLPDGGGAAVGAGALQLCQAVRRAVQRPRITIRTCAPNPTKGARWGDTHFAASLARAFTRAGFDARCHTVAEWDQPQAQPFDVVLHLRGLHRLPVAPFRTNVLWIISHGDDVTDDELDDYDLVLVASRPFAERLRERTDRPVHVLHQATDPILFRPPRSDLRHAASGVVVVANARFPQRRAPRWLMQLGWDFELYGAHWENFPERRFVVDTYVPNDELADVYATADVVVADQWDHMAREGFVANRLFDVAAAGGFVVSDAGPGVTEVFGDLVPVYSSREELDELLRRYAHDPGGRDRIATGAMRLVRAQHTFDVRVSQLLELLSLGS